MAWVVAEGRKEGCIPALPCYNFWENDKAGLDTRAEDWKVSATRADCVCSRLASAAVKSTLADKETAGPTTETA